MRPQRPRRFLRRFGILAGSGFVISGFSLLLILEFHGVVLAQSPLAEEDSLLHIVRTLEKCAILSKQTEKEFVGVQEKCPLFRDAVIANEVVAKVAGTGPTGAERGKGNLIDAWKNLGVPDEETTFLKKLMVSWFGFGLNDPRIQDASGVGGLRVAKPYEPLQSLTELDAILQPSKNPWSRETFASLYQDAMKEHLRTALENIKEPGRPFPEFTGQLDDDLIFRSGSSSSGSAQGAGTNIIAKDASFNEKIQDVLVRTPGLLVTEALDTSLAVTNPDQPLPHPLLNREGQAPIVAAEIGDRLNAGGAGRSVSLTGLGQPPPTLTADLVNQQVLAALAQQVANTVQRQLDTIAKALDFFGSSTAGGLSNRLGTEAFNSLLQSFNPAQLGSGGGTGGNPPQQLADIPMNPPVIQCQNQTPSISADVAKGIAALSSLPLSADGGAWNSTYVPVSSLLNISGQDFFSGGTITLEANKFVNPESCVWLISSTGTADVHAVFIEDVANSAGLIAHLLVSTDAFAAP